MNDKNGVKRWRSFVGLTLLGGLGVILPLTIFILVLLWVFGLLGDVVSPLSSQIERWVAFDDKVADLLSLVIVLGVCFAIGLVVKTQVGRWLHERIDAVLARVAPGYKTIREVVSQVLGGEKNTSLLSGQVCRAWILGREHAVSTTGIVTAEHSDGSYTVYVPTAPVPSSGLVYHLPADCVQLLPHVRAEEALRTVIACGAGSQVIVEGRLPEDDPVASGRSEP